MCLLIQSENIKNMFQRKSYYFITKLLELEAVKKVRTAVINNESDLIKFRQTPKQHRDFQLKLISLMALYNYISKLTMPVPYRSKQPKRRYAKISLKKRQTLIELVINQGKGLTKTAKKLNLKLSTAKLILRKFKQTGQFHIRKLRQNPSPTEPAVSSSQENNAVISMDECPQKNNYEMPQYLPISTNIYPLVYGQTFYPFINYYGMWNFENNYLYF